ncbi:MAG: hypothetical protein IKQ08_12100, partial [Paludibacteraceae bacterium]|nr:hypothetical protein [Paludibacteraceae bacterium]
KSLSSLNTVFLSHTKPFSIGMGKPTVVLSANNSTVSISDFFDEANILALPGSVRLNNNCLPEGSYMFCFQAFDAMAYFGGQRIPISKEFALTAFMEDGAAPILLSPKNNDSIPCMATDINFQWQQPFVTSGLNTYTLQIAEVTSPSFDSPQVLEIGDYLIERPGLMVPMCNIPRTESNFKENHTYYWRVIMCDKNGTPRYNYPNKGASPAYRFVYCGTPQEPEPEDPWEQKVPQAKAIGKGLDTLRMDSVRVDKATTCTAIWFKDSVEVREKYDGVIIEVKKKTQDTWTPFKLESTVRTDTTIELSSLSYNDSFMVRGQYYMLEEGKPVYAPYSDTVYFRIKHPADTVDCGAPIPELTDCSGSGERSEFRLGDRFSANGTSVTIDSIISQKVNGSSLTLTGLGHIPFPILSNFGLKVSFTDVEINCDDQLRKGTVVSVYDEKTAAMIDLNNLIGKGNKGNDLGQSDAILNDGDGDVSNLGEGDVILNGNNITMKDTAGNEISVGTVIDLSSSSVYSDNTSLKDSKVYIKFSNPDYENIAFDDDDQKLRNSSFTLADNYRDFGGGYIIPWVASNPGRKFQLKATPSDNFKSEGYTDVKFVIPASSGKHIELESEANGDDYMVSIPGISTNKQSTVYAIARKSADSPYENVGKLNLCCYTFKTKRLVIVPLVDGITVSADEVKTALEKIYGKLGYTFEVEVDNAHSNGVRKSIALESTVMSEFSSDMKEVINGYKANIDADASYSYDKSAAYLFLMEKPEGSFSETKGIMPQKQQFGFIFMQGSQSVSSAETHTMAHELGHGLFGLDHVFIKSYGITEGSTHNLMDYTKNTPDDFLSYHEWSQINSPVMSWSLFNSDEGNMDVVYVDISAPEGQVDFNHAIDPNGNLIYLIKSQDPNLTVVFGCRDDYRSLETFWLYRKGTKDDKVVTYKWNSNKNTYVDENGNDVVNDNRILLKYNTNKTPQRVAVYKSTGDKCIVKSAIITFDPVKKEYPSEILNWESHYSFSATDDCWNQFYQNIYLSDKNCKGADADELAALKNLKSDSPASEVEKTINGCTQCTLAELGYDRVIDLFKILARQEKIDDHSEFAILRLMSVIRDGNYADFFNTLEDNNNELIINLVKEMHDRIPYFTVAAEIVNGYKEGDNYTHFIAALCTMVRQRPATLGLRLNALDDLPVFLEETPYEGLQFGFLSILNKYRYNFSYDETTGNLKPYKESSSYSLYHQKLLADLVYRLISGEDNYVFDEFLGGSVSPLTPVIILPGSSKDLMTVALSDEKMKEGTVYVVPALFFKYVKDKIFAKTIENGVTVALDVATVIGSGGTLLATKVHWAKRIWACVELSSVLCDVVLMSDVIQNKELKSYIETYNNIVGFISFAKDISSGLSKMDKSKNIQKEIVENTENTGAAVKERIENGAIDCLEKSEDIDVSKLSTDEINSYKKVAEVIKTVVAPKTSGKWTEYVGKNIDDLTTAPEGYCIYSRNGKKWIRRLDVTDESTPRLTVKQDKNGKRFICTFDEDAAYLLLKKGKISLEEALSTVYSWKPDLDRSIEIMEEAKGLSWYDDILKKVLRKEKSCDKLEDNQIQRLIKLKEEKHARNAKKVKGEYIFYTENGEEALRITKEGFLIMPAKGKRFHPREFLTDEYVDALLDEIKKDGVGFVMRKGADCTDSRWGNQADRKFVGNLTKIKEFLKESNGKISEIAYRLDLGTPYFNGTDELYLVTVDLNKYHIDLPDGNEFGAYEFLWMPGGYTKHGTPESVLVEGFVHNNNWNTYLEHYKDNVVYLGHYEPGYEYLKK